MEELGAVLVFTGEVLGERPMSQRRPILDIIEQESGLNGRLLRPLSAKLLPETIPEKEGLIEREKLLDISGRNRKPQLDLAKKYGFEPDSKGRCRCIFHNGDNPSSLCFNDKIGIFIYQVGWKFIGTFIFRKIHIYSIASFFFFKIIIFSFNFIKNIY